MRKLVRPAHGDPHNSVDLFDADRKNQWGEMYCVAPAILSSQIESEWARYSRSEMPA